MAGVEWKGAKCKGGGQDKSVLRHTDKGERLKREHENPDIDRDKTEQNFSYRGLTYGQKCKRYDEQVASAKVKRQSTGKNANTTMVGWVFYLPKGLQKEDHTDPEVVKSWFRDLGDLLNKRYGADFIDMDVHVDEVHLYKDARSGEWEWSRIHGHGAVVPVIEVDGERVLNGKQFCSRKNIKSLNQAIHEMSMEKYGVPYMENADKKKDNEKSGEKSDKKMDRRSISQLKAESAKKLMEAEVAIAERERALDEKEQALNDRAKKQAIRQKKQEANKKVLDDTIQDLRERSVKIRDREGRVAERETDVDAKRQEQEEREKEFQKREDALEAQTRFLDEREQAVSEREAVNQELILLGRRVKAGQISEGIQSEEHGERRLPDISSIGYGG